jgi:chemotaxis protein histidine kinase CheA
MKIVASSKQNSTETPKTGLTPSSLTTGPKRPVPHQNELQLLGKKKFVDSSSKMDRFGTASAASNSGENRSRVPYRPPAQKSPLFTGTAPDGANGDSWTQVSGKSGKNRSRVPYRPPVQKLSPLTGAAPDGANGDSWTQASGKSGKNRSRVPYRPPVQKLSPLTGAASSKANGEEESCDCLAGIVCKECAKEKKAAEKKAAVKKARRDAAAQRNRDEEAAQRKREEEAAQRKREEEAEATAAVTVGNALTFAEIAAAAACAPTVAVSATCATFAAGAAMRAATTETKKAVAAKTKAANAISQEAAYNACKHDKKKRFTGCVRRVFDANPNTGVITSADVVGELFCIDLCNNSAKADVMFKVVPNKGKSPYRAQIVKEKGTESKKGTENEKEHVLSHRTGQFEGKVVCVVHNPVTDTVSYRIKTHYGCLSMPACSGDSEELYALQKGDSVYIDVTDNQGKLSVVLAEVDEDGDPVVSCVNPLRTPGTYTGDVLCTLGENFMVIQTPQGRACAKRNDSSNTGVLLKDGSRTGNFDVGSKVTFTLVNGPYGCRDVLLAKYMRLTKGADILITQCSHESDITGRCKTTGKSDEVNTDDLEGRSFCRKCYVQFGKTKCEGCACTQVVGDLKTVNATEFHTGEPLPADNKDDRNKQLSVCTACYEQFKIHLFVRCDGQYCHKMCHPNDTTVMAGTTYPERRHCKKCLNDHETCSHCAESSPLSNMFNCDGRYCCETCYDEQAKHSQFTVVQPKQSQRQRKEARAKRSQKANQDAQAVERARQDKKTYLDGLCTSQPEIDVDAVAEQKLLVAKLSLGSSLTPQKIERQPGERGTKRQLNKAGAQLGVRTVELVGDDSEEAMIAAATNILDEAAEDNRRFQFGGHKHGKGARKMRSMNYEKRNPTMKQINTTDVDAIIASLKYYGYTVGVWFKACLSVRFAFRKECKECYEAYEKRLADLRNLHKAKLETLNNLIDEANLTNDPKTRDELVAQLADLETQLWDIDDKIGKILEEPVSKDTYTGVTELIQEFIEGKFDEQLYANYAATELLKLRVAGIVEKERRAVIAEERRVKQEETSMTEEERATRSWDIKVKMLVQAEEERAKKEQERAEQEQEQIKQARIESAKQALQDRLAREKLAEQQRADLKRAEQERAEKERDEKERAEICKNMKPFTFTVMPKTPITLGKRSRPIKLRV